MPSWLTLTRLSTATRFDNTGTLVDVAADTARFDYAYNGASWTNQGLLLEKQSTNIYLNSNNINTFNVKTNVTNALISNSPLGTVNEVTVTDIGSRARLDSYSANNGDTVARRFYLKKGTYAGSLNAVFYTVNPANSVINLTTKSIDSGSGSIKATSNDWIDFRIVQTTTVTASSYRTDLRVQPDAGTENVGKTYLVGHIQVELNTYNSSPINTNGSAVTRSADNLRFNVSNYTGSIKLTYKRQDTDATESAWIDLTNATNPILTNSVAVGIWLQNIAVYNRTLTAQEKANA